MGITCFLIALIAAAFAGLTWFMCAASAKREKEFRRTLDYLILAERHKWEA